MSAHKVELVPDLGCCHQIIWAGRGFVVVPLSALHHLTLHPTEARAAQSAGECLGGRELALGGILWGLLWWWHPLKPFDVSWDDKSLLLAVTMGSLGIWTPEWDVLKVLYVKLMVSLWVSKAWPEVMGSLLACADTDVPESIFPLQGT